MIPELSENDMKMFYRYLDNSTIYFEYGSGGSTYQASLRQNIKKIYTVESDKTCIAPSFHPSLFEQGKYFLEKGFFVQTTFST